MEIQDYVEEKLIEMGATPEYVGYRYLLCAIMMTIQNEAIINRVTVNLYPAVGEQFGASPANVERSMRTVLAAIWCDGEQKTIKAILGREYKEQLSNAKFLGIASKMLQIGYRKYVACREESMEK